MQLCVRSGKLRQAAPHAGSCQHAGTALAWRRTHIWRQQQCSRSSEQQPQRARGDRQQLHSASLDDAQSSTDAYLDEPAAAPHGEGAVTSVDPGVPPEAPPGLEVSLRSDPWAWRRQQLGIMGRFCGERTLVHGNCPIGRIDHLKV